MISSLPIAPLVNATPHSVLIVEDDSTFRRALESVLATTGYRVWSAGEPDGAYALLAAVPVDAVLLDINLPTMSGLALYLAIVRRWPALEGRIALMSGDADAAEVRRCLETRPCPVFRKPFRFELAERVQDDNGSDAPGPCRFGGRRAVGGQRRIVGGSFH